MLLSRDEALGLVIAMAYEFSETSVSSDALKKAQSLFPGDKSIISKAMLVQAQAILDVKRLLMEVLSTAENPEKVRQLAAQILEERGLTQ
jgi:hypothetical protein